MKTQDFPPLAARFLEQTLLLYILVNLLAMLSMAFLLLPGMPGGSNADAAGRAAYLAEHPWRWHLGWVPWQLSAFCALLLAVAMLRTPWVPRLPALLTLIATITAVVIEQPGELRWSFEGITLAREAVRSENLGDFLRLETLLYPRVVGWAALGYVAAACCWTWAFAGAGTWTPLQTRLSVAALTILLVCAVSPLLPESIRPTSALMAVGNGLGFVLLLAWLILVTECVLRRARPTETHGRQMPWRYPRRGFPGLVLEALANCRLARAYGEWLPPVAFVSDITDVIYVNYLVEAERLEHLVPWGLELQRLGPDKNLAFFTFLTYRHGHFGPRLLGPLRRLLPSPIQSNWRIHVRNPHSGVQGIYFVTTAISHTLNALAARWLAEGMSMHVPIGAEVRSNPEGDFRVLVDPGSGTAPDIAASLRPAAIGELPYSWHLSFSSYRDMLAYCVPQDRAFSSQPWYRRITRQEIQLGIPLDSCQPLEGQVESRAARDIVGDARPVCFRVARVAFRFEREEHD